MRRCSGMKISRAIIKNFRCYYGENEVVFNNNGKITLVYGHSGYGKSSFLQFFKWVLYNEVDFGINDKPIYNIHTCSECKFGEKFRVSGKIEFEHNGVKYELEKTETYKKQVVDATFVTSELKLQYLNNGWEDYPGKIDELIRSILPKELSKYFLLDGEKARDIVLDKKNLKQAIFSLFGIDEYDNAISHIGYSSKKSSVIGKLNEEMMKEIGAGGKKGIEPLRIQARIDEYNAEVEKYKNEIKKNEDLIAEKSAERDKILTLIGERNNKKFLLNNKKSNDSLITECEANIKRIKEDISKVCYKNYPYLILSKVIADNCVFLQKMDLEYSSKYNNVFENLKKELLVEIKEKGVCVCGRPLDEESRDVIEGILGVMPPAKHTYLFGQYLSKAKTGIAESKVKVLKIEQLFDALNDKEKKIFELDEANKEIVAELKALESADDLIERHDKLEAEITTLKSENYVLSKKQGQANTYLSSLIREHRKAVKEFEVSDKYSKKIKFFEEIKKILEKEKADREKSVRVTLNKYVRETYSQLTTQGDIDPEKINFVNDDFTLRQTFLTGGQKAVDEYSYIMGIIKSLKEFNLDSNETPVIIDAPFAFTDNTQSQHIFEAFPSVSSQTILLTLDLNKIMPLLSDESRYELYVIETSESQDKATITRGDINAITD